jgi:DNA-binding NarL/FixJ family response regulator
MKSHRHVLILDPSPIFRSTLTEVIQSSESHVDVSEADNIEQAESILKRNVPDVIFLDIASPRNNGIQFISAIKRIVPQARVVVLSSYDSAEYKEASIRNGADYFLSKERSGGLRLLDVIHDAIRGRN